MIKSTSATVALSALIVVLFVLVCRFFGHAPFGMPTELENSAPPAMISSRL
ncbi:hypothetical protein [Hwanghaeella grinnelliae]|uniref:hypothetical protein n=1 Tax=Hwanghaeella grinnelliae TaxID=2500179 RepID=UPI00129B7858|nr:hypothetical protein [Hwanghaeella grinnelliae]